MQRSVSSLIKMSYNSYISDILVNLCGRRRLDNVSTVNRWLQVIAGDQGVVLLVPVKIKRERRSCHKQAQQKDSNNKEGDFPRLHAINWQKKERRNN